jgi:hypothetical protein
MRAGPLILVLALCGCATALSTVLWPTLGQANVDEHGKYGVLGQGTTSCGEWTKARTEKQWPEVAKVNWLMGYLTAFNIWGAGPSDISEGTDPEGVGAWIDNYCAQHPLDSLAKAAEQLIYELGKRTEPQGPPAQ